MSNRLKRVFSTVLCAAVMLTMTAVPGTAFAENIDGSEVNAQTEVQSPDEQAPGNENEAEAVTPDENDGAAEAEDDAQTPEEAAGEATVTAAVQTAAKQMNSAIALYKFSVTVDVTYVGERNGNTVTVCKGSSVGLKAVLVDATSGTYDYVWYKKGSIIPVGYNSSYTPKDNGSYYAIVNKRWDLKFHETSPTITVNFADHNYKSVAAKDATCTEDGNTAYRECSRCGKMLAGTSGTTETTADAVKIKALGHTMQKTDAREATCTEAGNNEYYTCDRCHKVYKDAAGAAETTVAAETIPANGHTMKRVDKHDATCTEDGHEEYWRCAECGYLSSDSEGQNEISNPVLIPAKGHDFGEWKVTKEATVQAKGIKERACKNCEYKETAEIPMLTADKNTDVKKAADKSAETGDDMNIALYGLLALAAAAGAAGTLYRRKTN